MNPTLNNQTLPVNNQINPSGISHAFDTGFAIAYGVDEAIMIRNLQFFITANANRGQNFHEGRFWTYDRLEDFPNHFPYWTAKQCRRVIASLIHQGVIITGDFNKCWSNRTCWYAFKDQSKFIQNIKPPKTPLPYVENLARQPENKESFADLPKRANEICPNGQMTNAQTGNCIYDYPIPDTISINTSLKVPPDEAASPMSATADGGGVCKTPKKSKREAPEFSTKVREVAAQMISLLIKYNPVYRPPDDLSKFLYHVEQMVEKEKQDIQVLLKTFEWAVSDNEQRGDFKGWQGIVVTNKKAGKVTNPAQIFRDAFSKINSQMRSRPPRKFAPNSNDDKALEIMTEMSSRAI